MYILSLSCNLVPTYAQCTVWGGHIAYMHALYLLLYISFYLGGGI